MQIVGGGFVDTEAVVNNNEICSGGAGDVLAAARKGTSAKNLHLGGS